MIAVDLNSGADVAIIVGGVGVVLSGVGWLLRHYKESIVAEVRSSRSVVMAEVKSNGGDTDSLGDRVVRIEDNQVASAERISRIEEHLSEHVASDLEIQKRAAEALIEGQTSLLNRLEALEKPKPTTRRRTTK